MARARHRKPNSTRKSRDTQSEKPPSYLKQIRYLTRRGLSPDPTNERAVRRKYRETKARENLEKLYSHPVTAPQKKILKARGFHISKRGVAIDGPRDYRRGKSERIKGAKFRVSKDGLVSWSVGERRDFIYGLTAQEKKQFARDPDSFTASLLKRLRATNPTMRAVKPSRIQTRLQWGAFQATKGFAPTYFTAKYFADASPEEIRERGKRKAAPRIDKLTGLHFVVHLPTKGKRKRAKRRKSK